MGTLLTLMFPLSSVYVSLVSTSIKVKQKVIWSWIVFAYINKNSCRRSAEKEGNSEPSSSGLAQTPDL